MSSVLIVLTIVAAGIYIAAMQQDLSHRKIPNSLSIAIVVIAAIKWIVLGDISPAMWAFIVASMIFIVTFGLFALGWMGGGDVKLLTASSFLLGAWATYPFLVYTALAGGLVTLAVLIRTLGLRWLRPRSESDVGGTVNPAAATVPYGVAISIGAIWIMAQQSLLSYQTLLR